MNRKHHKVKQNSDEWYDLRMGRFTASSFKDLFSPPNTAAYKKAIYKVAYEKITGEQPESYSNDWMERGHQLEPLAIEAYEVETFNTVTPSGFWSLGDWIGASPDGLINNDGLLEVKSPAFNTMIDYLLKKKLPTIYKWQVYGQMYVTGRDYCDFISYHPKLKPMILKIERDESIINELHEKLMNSINEAKNIIDAITH